MEVRSDASSPGDAERESTAAAPFAMAAAMHCRQCSPKCTRLKSTSSGLTVASFASSTCSLLAQSRSKSAKPPKAGGQFVTDGGSHAPTRTRGRRSDLCGGSSELGGGGDGRLGFVTDASRGAIFGLLAPPPHPQCRPRHKIAAHSRIFRGLFYFLLVLHCWACLLMGHIKK